MPEPVGVAQLRQNLSRRRGRDLSPLDAFVTYDERQGAVARLAGLRSMAPGG